MNVEKVTIESDERGFELHLLVDEDISPEHRDLIVLNIQGVVEELWDEMQKKVGPWIAERDNAYQEWRVNRAAGEYEGPWLGENAMDYFRRTGNAEPLMEFADELRERAKTER